MDLHLPGMDGIAALRQLRADATTKAIPIMALTASAKTKLVSIAQGVDFLGYRLIRVKGHLNVYLTPAVVERCRAQVRQLTRRTAGG